jgi:serine/threonine-protein kinase
MGRILLAHDAKLGRAVAIKVIREDFAGEKQYVERFWREARAAAAIGHPNIVQVYEVGETTGGVPYIVMEALDGHDLRRELRAQGRLPVERAVDIAGQVLFALAAAHRAGVVHRDLKPGNIFLARREAASFRDLEADRDPVDSTVTVKLLDFGVSRFLRFAAAGRELTGEGSILGTLQYMAPEQLDDSVEVDGRADLFAVGVILYECVTGVSPFGSDDAQAVMRRALGQTIVPAHEVVPGLPRSLSDVLARAMAFEPNARFPDALRFIEALRPLLHAPAARSLDAGVAPRGSASTCAESTTGGDTTWIHAPDVYRSDDTVRVDLADAPTLVMTAPPDSSFSSRSDEAPTSIRPAPTTPDGDAPSAEDGAVGSADEARVAGRDADGGAAAPRSRSRWRAAAVLAGLASAVVVAVWLGFAVGGARETDIAPAPASGSSTAPDAGADRGTAAEIPRAAESPIGPPASPDAGRDAPEPLVTGGAAPPAVAPAADGAGAERQRPPRTRTRRPRAPRSVAASEPAATGTQDEEPDSLIVPGSPTVRPGSDTPLVRDAPW